MVTSYSFSVIRFCPDKRRGEIVNIGIAAFLPGNVDVRLLPQLSKAAAIAPDMDFTGAAESISEEIVALYKQTGDARRVVELLARETPIQCSPLGWFSCAPEDYDARLHDTMRRLVLPPTRPSAREGRSRLYTEVKREFARFKMLGKEREDINKHKIIAGFSLPGEEDLQADFMAKNGVYHLTQVVDYRTTAKGVHGKIKELSLKAVALHQAPRLLDVKTIKTYALLWIPTEFEDIAMPQVELLRQYTQNILRYDQQDDRATFWKAMAEATHYPGQLQLN